ncbi:hypothetical protein AC579_8248 [Pseudocercospora musae]|uniref:Uncharacterized protein n=1 Tax=Pseudocercospora musae TaxID=113226 RepID=A0A139IVK3_9PEZI|nr:hypothetical protein AC579_8248 [Pseudocercospora musae]
MSVERGRLASKSRVLHNCLQLPRIAQGVLDDHIAVAHDILLGRQSISFLLWKIDPTILRDPASRLRELYDSAFRVEEEQVLRVRNWEGWDTE